MPGKIAGGRIFGVEQNSPKIFNKKTVQKEVKG